MNKDVSAGAQRGAPVSGYADVNGLKMYYEIHGAKKTPDAVPLVLIHGAFSATGTSFEQILPGLARERQVMSVELQAHGRTADIDRPIRSSLLAEDVVALLGQLKMEKADILGYSLGADVALNIAIHHPQVVRKLVLVSVSYRMDGLHPEASAGTGGELKPEYLFGSPFHDEYMKLAPNPQDFAKLVDKINDFDKHIEDWPEEQIRAIQAPTMVILGDSDIVRPEHAVEIFRLLGGGVAGDLAGLPNARLAILPGTTHVTVAYRGEWVSSMVNDFLEAEVK